MAALIISLILNLVLNNSPKEQKAPKGKDKNSQEQTITTFGGMGTWSDVD